MRSWLLWCSQPTNTMDRLSLALFFNEAWWKQDTAKWRGNISLCIITIAVIALSLPALLDRYWSQPPFDSQSQCDLIWILHLYDSLRVKTSNYELYTYCIYEHVCVSTCLLIIALIRSSCSITLTFFKKPSITRGLRDLICCHCMLYGVFVSTRPFASLLLIIPVELQDMCLANTNYFPD